MFYYALKLLLDIAILMFDYISSLYILMENFIQKATERK